MLAATTPLLYGILFGIEPIAGGFRTVPADTSQIVVLSLTSRVFDNTRAIRVYLPPGYPAEPDRRYPVLYLNDGFSIFSARSWNAPRALDSLIAAGTIPPMILVGIDNAASIPGVQNPGAARAREFLPYPDPTEPELRDPRGERYPEFVTDEVMPLIARSFRVLEGERHTGIGGSSYGGVAALTTVLRRPGRFGMLLLESTPLFLFDGRLVDESGALGQWPGAVYVGVGSRETDDPKVSTAGRQALERFAAIARQTGTARVRFTVAEGATHNAAAWRTRLPDALTFLFGPR